jgi:hypothetical protein
VEGLDCLGVDDQSGDMDYLTFLKKYGPNVIDKKIKAKVGSATGDWFKKEGKSLVPAAEGAINDALKDKPKDGSGVDADKAKIAKSKSGGGGNWFTDPVMGPVPGWGVLGIVVGAAGAVGFAVKKIFF